MVVSGARLTTNITQARRVVDMAKDIALLDPNDAPFVTILKLAKKDVRWLIRLKLNGMKMII